MAHLTRSYEEARTHELMENFLKNDANWSAVRALIAATFKAKYHAALDRDHIRRIAEALGDCKIHQDGIDTGLKAMVRAKVLRSRVERGQRLYEVNY